MNSERGAMSSLESRIVAACHSSFSFNSQLKVKALVAVTADESETTFVDIDKTISRDDHGKLDVGPRNALQQWKKSQNEQVSWQNQWLQQQQPRMRGEVKSLRASVPSPSQRFRMPQMPARVRMMAPPMQSPRMSGVRMLQPCVPQSVVRLKKIPSHLDATQSIVLAALSAVKSLPTQERLAIAGNNESGAEGATRDRFLPSGAEIENSSNQMNNSSHSLVVAQLRNQTSLPAVANKNKRKTGNQQNLFVCSDGENEDSIEPWKKIPRRLPSGQKAKKALMEHPEEGQEEEEMKEVEEDKNSKAQRPKVGNVDSKESWKKIPKRLPSGQKAMKALKEHSEEEQEDEEMKEVEENKNCKPQRPKVKKISKLPSGQKAMKAIKEHSEEEQEDEEMKEMDEDKNCKPQSWKKISKITRGQKAKKAAVEHPEEEEEEEDKKEEKEEEEEKIDKPNRTRTLNKMTASLQTTTQDMEAMADELLTSKAAPTKRAKKVEHVDEAMMPKLEKVVDNASFWNTFVSKGTGKKKAAAKQAKS